MGEHNALLKLHESYKERGLFGTTRKIFDRLMDDLYRRTTWRKNLRSLQSKFGNAPRAEIFSYIYDKRIWLSRESISGYGSTLDATENTRANIKSILKDFSIKSIYDAPCGDFNWMRLCVADTDVSYTGADIVPELIRHNRERYQSKTVQFVVRDIVVDPFPSVDLWLCRDCFIHLSFEDILRSLELFCSTDSRYLLVDSYINNGEFENLDIKTGHYRMVDLFSDPFNFPKSAIFRFPEYSELERSKEMVLFTRQDVSAVLPAMRERIKRGGFAMAPVAHLGEAPDSPH